MAVQKKSSSGSHPTDEGSLHKRGDGLGTGKVGTGGRTETKKPAGSSKPSSSKPSTGSSSSSRPASSGTGSRPSSSSGTGSRPSSVSSAKRPSPNQRPGSSDADKGLVDSLFSTNTASSSSSSSHQSSGSGSGLLGGGGGLMKLILPIALVAIIFFVGKSLLGGGGSTTEPTYNTPATQGTQGNQGTTFNVGSAVSGSGLTSVLQSLGLSDVLGGTGTGSFNIGGTGSNLSGTWSAGKNTGVLNSSVSSDAAKKRTKLLGNKRDVMTIMVYMCGTDLESKYGMGTSDLQEMLNASSNDNLNIIVFTGGCKEWKNNVVSSTNNMILQVKDGKIYKLQENAGQASMVNPDTLSGFIKYCDQNFPANRNMLILWDHGGGSVSGYGYDEKYARSGAMSLDNLDKALSDSGVTFDIIGFDACLMATYETAHVCSRYADYMIASEESEPGVGWYYTEWVDALAKNTSMPSLNIGKNIIDGFVSECARKCAGQATTLSLVDLAEFSAIGDDLDVFSGAVNTQVNSDYQTVASSRAASHEFAAANRLDQVDLVDLASRIGTKEAKAFADKLLSAIKYNQTGSGVSNAYGLSIYFPNSSSKYVDTAVKIYKKIGLPTSYIKLIQNYASMQVSGQASSQYSLGSSLSSLLGGGSSDTSNSLGSGLSGDIMSSGLLSLLGGGSNQSNSSTSGTDISSLLGLLGGGSSSSSSSSSGLDFGSLLSSLTGGASSFLTGRELSDAQAGQYIADNLFDPANLNWKEDSKGNLYISMEKDQWELVTDIALSMYYDDSKGYIDLGIDNVYAFDANGNMLAPEEAEWFTVDGQWVAYYYENEVWDGSNYQVNGYIPALLNKEQVKLRVVFDNDHPKGYIAGAELVYKDGETELQGKVLTGLQEGDVIDFIADYYTYNGQYDDTYMIGEQYVVSGEPVISKKAVDAGHADMMYRFTDIYSNYNWSEGLVN